MASKVFLWKIGSVNIRTGKEDEKLENVVQDRTEYLCFVRSQKIDELTGLEPQDDKTTSIRKLEDQYLVYMTR